MFFLRKKTKKDRGSVEGIPPFRPGREAIEDFIYEENDDTDNVLNATHNIEYRPHVVILIHGIRTHAKWYERVEKKIQDNAGDIRVVKPKYGKF